MLAEKIRTAHRHFEASGNADDAAEYALNWYDDLVAFFVRAAKARKHVIFHVNY